MRERKYVQCTLAVTMSDRGQTQVRDVCSECRHFKGMQCIHPPSNIRARCQLSFSHNMNIEQCIEPIYGFECNICSMLNFLETLGGDGKMHKFILDSCYRGMDDEKQNRASKSQEHWESEHALIFETRTIFTWWFIRRYETCAVRVAVIHGE